MEHSSENERKGFGSWLSESLVARLIFIGVLTLLLLIPNLWTTNIIQERQATQYQTIEEITENWADIQTLSGPVLIVPYTYDDVTVANNKKTVTTHQTNLYLLPEELNVTGNVSPEVLHRNIYEAVVYNSKIKISGRFGEIEVKKSGINLNNLHWDKARIAIGLSDLKGLTTNPNLHFSGQSVPLEVDSYNSSLFENTLIAVPDFSKINGSAHNFNLEIDLRGSTALFVTPLGKKNSISLQGNWPDPKFEGSYLPDKRNVAAEGFTASWSVPYFNRKQPQQWLDKQTRLTNYKQASDSTTVVSEEQQTLGVRFLLPVDNYQKTMRTIKYSILVIFLTFISLFFTEILTKKRAHPIQYILIGAAMIVYYSLLLSFSEHIGFNWAYGVASVATIALITSFILGILKSKKAALIFSLILSIFYIFIFVIMQLETLSLLFGSIGIFITIAILMYLSNKINWNKTA